MSLRPFLAAANATVTVVCLALMLSAVSGQADEAPSAPTSGFRAGIALHVVGDHTVTGAMDGGRRVTYSFRRYLYHHLVSQGIAVRFVGANNDCGASGSSLPPPDFDASHSGFYGQNTPTVQQRLQQSASTVSQSVKKAVDELLLLFPAGETKKKAAAAVRVVTIVISGGVDAEAGTRRNDISDNHLVHLLTAAEQAVGTTPVPAEYIVVPTPPPSGKRTLDAATGAVIIERDWDRDVKYEDYRFFLTWRGHFFERRRINLDCFSSFDFEQHYDVKGARLNHLGDQALAWCLADGLRTRGFIPALLPSEGGAKKAVAQCKKTLNLDASEAVAARIPVMNRATRTTIPVARELVPVIRWSSMAQPHSSCEGKPPSAAAPPPESAPAVGSPRAIDQDEDAAAPKEDGKKAPSSAGTASSGGVCASTRPLDTLSLEAVKP